LLAPRREHDHPARHYRVDERKSEKALRRGEEAEKKHVASREKIFFPPDRDSISEERADRVIACVAAAMSWRQTARCSRTRARGKNIA